MERREPLESGFPPSALSFLAAESPILARNSPDLAEIE
jgi:hypothetical protein